MKKNTANKVITEKNRIPGSLPYLVFFASIFIFFAFVADYVGFYQEKQSLFIFSADYFGDTVARPGSLLVYLGRFITTFFHVPVLGGLLLTLIIGLQTLLIAGIISLLNGRKGIIVPLLFGTAFFALQGNYQYLVHNNLGILLQLLFFYLAVRHPRGWLPVMLFPFWYLITGGFAWMFAMMYSLHLAFKSLKKEWPKIIIMPGATLLMIWLLGEFFLFYNFRDLVVYPLSREGTGTPLILFPAVAMAVILLPAIAKIRIGIPLAVKRIEKYKTLIILIVAFLLAAITAVLRYSKMYSEYFTAERLFYGEKYRELNDYIDRHPSTNRLTIYLNNIALCETGRLTDKMFHYLQSPDGQSLFLKWEMYGEVLRRGAYFYYTTGMINEAERWAFENMVMKGIAPEDLRILVKSEIINGNYKVAAKYASMLSRTFAYRKEAKEYLGLLADTTLIDSHPKLGKKRGEKIEHDFFSITDNPYINIEMAFVSDTFNRKLFDYRMAYQMLTENYEGIVAGLPHLERLGFTRVPVHIQEAALVSRMSGLSLSGLGSLRIDPQTETRFTQFLQTFNSYGNNLKTAQPALRQRFGETFWYYAFYH
ncbi:MAG: DUF6057 family protein [Bacteroidales bacterium]